MAISYIYLFLTLNYVTTVASYYKKCYEEFSVCLITNTDDPSLGSRFRLNRRSADDWCKEKSSSLVIITNANVQSAIEAFIKDSSAKLNSDVITIGYRHNLGYWEWINGRRRSADYQFSAYIYYGYAYLLVSPGATLKPGIPRIEKNFICSHLRNNSNCPDGHHQLNDSCYKIYSNEAATWFVARNICLQEGYDLATFADIDLSSNPGWLPNGEYWVGLRSEIWYWLLDKRIVEIKYSNWDTNRPYMANDCLCLTANTGKWKDCYCSQRHRYICIQDYTPNSTAPTTIRITTSITQTVDQSTLIAIVDDSFKQPDDSEDSGKKNSDSQRLIIWIPLAILIILIVVFAAWIVVKKYSKRSNKPMLDGGSTKNETNQSPSSEDEYATVMPETSTENRTYAQLQLYETIGDDTK